MTEDESLEDECLRRIRHNRDICETRELCSWQPNRDQSSKKSCGICQLKNCNNQTTVPTQFLSTARNPYPTYGEQMNVNSPSWATNQGISPQNYTQFNGRQSFTQLSQFQNVYRPSQQILPGQQFQTVQQSPQGISNVYVNPVSTTCTPCSQKQNPLPQDKAPGLPFQTGFQQYHNSTKLPHQISQIQQLQTHATSPPRMSNGFSNSVSPCTPCSKNMNSLQKDQVPGIPTERGIQQCQNSSQLAQKISEQFQSNTQSPKRISNDYANPICPTCTPCSQKINSQQQAQLSDVPTPFQSEVLNQVLSNQAKKCNIQSINSSPFNEECECVLSNKVQKKKNECRCDLIENSQKLEEKDSRETECNSCAEFSGKAQEPPAVKCPCDSNRYNKNPVLNENRNDDWHLEESDSQTCSEYNQKLGPTKRKLTNETGCPCREFNQKCQTQIIDGSGCVCDLKENTQKQKECASCNSLSITMKQNLPEERCCSNLNGNNQKPTSFVHSSANEKQLNEATVDRKNSTQNTKNTILKQCGCSLNEKTENDINKNSRLAGGGCECNSKENEKNEAGCCGCSSLNENTKIQTGCGGCGSPNGNSPKQSRGECGSCSLTGQNDTSLGIMDVNQVNTDLLQNIGQGQMNTIPNIPDISTQWHPDLRSTHGSPGYQMNANYVPMNVMPNIATPQWSTNLPESQANINQNFVDVTPPWGASSPGAQGFPIRQVSPGYQDFSQGIRPHKGPSPCYAPPNQVQPQFNQTGEFNPNDSSLGLINLNNVNTNLIDTSQQEQMPFINPANASFPGYNPQPYSPQFGPMNANLINITPQIPFSPEAYQQLPANVNFSYSSPGAYFHEPPTGQLISLSPETGPEAPINPNLMNFNPDQYGDLNYTPEYRGANGINQNFTTFSPEGCTCGSNTTNQTPQQEENLMNLNYDNINQNQRNEVPMGGRDISGLSPDALGNANASPPLSNVVPMTANLLNLTTPNNEDCQIPLNVTPPAGGILPPDQTPPPPQTSPRSLIQNLASVIRGQVLAGLRSPPTRNTWIMNDPNAPQSPDPVISPWQSPEPPTQSPNRTWATSSSSPIQPINITPPYIIEDSELVNQGQNADRVYMCAQDPNRGSIQGYDDAFKTPGFGGSQHLPGLNFSAQQTIKIGTNSSSITDQQNYFGKSKQMPTSSNTSTSRTKISRQNQCARPADPPSPPPKSCREIKSDTKKSSVTVEERPVRRSPCYLPPPPAPPCKSCRYS